MQMFEFFERFARGAAQPEPTLVSTVFAKHMLDLFKEEGCLSEDGKYLVFKRVVDGLKQSVFEVELFNQLISAECMFIVKSKNFDYTKRSIVERKEN